MDMFLEGGKAYEAACEVDTNCATVLAEADPLEEREWIHADTARVIV